MPGSIRLFVAHDLRQGEHVPATPGQAHYLGAVMRRGPGDPVLLFNGRDGEWSATVAALSRGQATLSVSENLRPQTPEPDLWLVFALLKRDPTDLVVQKATELGTAALLPVITDHTGPARPSPDRLLAIATEAAEQSERLTVPALAAPRGLHDVLAAWPPGRRLVAATERAQAPPIRARPGPGALLIGPEGGFSQGELDQLRRTPFVEPVSLGPRILRAETAAIAGLALLMAPPCGGG